MPLKQAIDIDESIARQEAIASEKCLLYVALTRAQRGAFITSYGKNQSS